MNRFGAVGPPEVLLKNFDFLNKLSMTLSRKRRIVLLNNASPGALLALVEIALNVLKGRFVLTNLQRKKLFPHADTVRKLAYVRVEKSALKILREADSHFFKSLLAPVLIEVRRAKNNGS